MSEVITVMNAAEVIKEIDRLPDTERAKVVGYVRKLSVGRRARKTHFVGQEKAAEVASRVFDKHSDLFKKLAE